MMREISSMTVRAMLACVIVSTAANAQAPRAASDAQTISRGWAALAAGRLEEATAAADGILKRKPRSHAALSLKIEALSASPRPVAALDAYESWLTTSRGNVDDRGLLEPIAAGILRTFAADADPLIRSAALRFLAASGDKTASDSLRKLSSEGDMSAAVALVSNGDPAAVSTLQTLVGSGTGRDVSKAIDALAEHSGMTPDLLDTLAKDRVPMNRAAAARALGKSTDGAAGQRLNELSRDPDPLGTHLCHSGAGRAGR